MTPDSQVLDRYPLPWRIEPRRDGMANIYCGQTVLAVCVPLDVAEFLMRAAITHVTTRRA